jgi:Flp pilus assembly protein TadD
MAAWQSAQQHLLAGRAKAALAGYLQLTKQFPNVPQLWAELGLAAAGDLDFAHADQATQRAADMAAADPDLLVSLGQQFHRLRRLDSAAACFANAVKADPASAHARLSLAAWLERSRRLDEAIDCVDACLAAHPHDAHARYFKGFLTHRKGLNAEAEKELRQLLAQSSLHPEVRYSATHLLGVVLDALCQYDDALAELTRAKTLLRQMTDTTSLEQSYDKTVQARRQFMNELKPDTIRRWREEAASETNGRSIVFLGGPPRSGTTLIEQVLGAHPQISVFDESEAFVQEILTPLCPPPPARSPSVKSLNALKTAERQRLTTRYFKSLLRDINPAPGVLLLDKNPSLTPSLHLWLRLFPMLKVLITLREPRDVILSCFFQNLALTAVNVNFLSLERTARFYADSMDVWLRLRDLGGFDWLETKYEDWVGGLENEGRKVMNFLGLPWRSEQIAFHESARGKFVFAPTYNEVTKPVHGRAMQRWKNYATAFAPLEERLAPYVRAFGYG